MPSIKSLTLLLLGLSIESIYSSNDSQNSLESTSNNTNDEVQLIFAHVIFRHGERNIYSPYPLDPYGSLKYWPEGYAQLTKTGKQQQFELGKYIRQRYYQFIGSGYSQNKIYFRSSDTDRTLMSAQCNAAGMFPISEDEVWHKGLKWSPIPIHTIEFSKDFIFNDGYIDCPRYIKMYRDFINSPEFKYQIERHEDFINYLETNSGRALHDPLEFMYMIALLYDEQQRGLVLPEWVKNISQYTNDTLEQIVGTHFEAMTHSNEMKKIKGGVLIREMLKRFKEKSLSRLRPDHSIWVYSAHDTTLANILNTLNVYELHIPPFASSIFFELYKRGGEYFVQLIYRKTPTEFVSALNIPNCGKMCPLDKFVEIYQDVLPTESEGFESLCKL